MTRSSTLRTLSLAAALVSAISLGGATVATTVPRSTHASAKAVAAASTGAANAATPAAAGHASATDAGQNADASAASTAAQSDIVGGAQQNHGGYVSCVARGGSDCTSTSPTLPAHGTVPSNVTLPTAATEHRH